MPRGKKWYGYYRVKVLDSIVETEKAKIVSVVLGLKSHMTKFQAREALEREITKNTGQNLGNRVMKDGSVTFGWFVRNRYFPLRESEWKVETAKVKRTQIERDLLERFESMRLDSFDKFLLQMHINRIAQTHSRDRVMQARSYLKSIFSEAVEQEYLMRDPSHNVSLPQNLREKDKTTLSWDQLRMVLVSLAPRDRVLFTLEMTEALRPSELFALRWHSFNSEKLTITETVYRGQVRTWGKTRRSLGTMHLPKGLADDLWFWKQECTDPSPEAFIFPNVRGGCMDAGNFRNRVMKPLGVKLGLPKLTFQVLRRTMATLAQHKGSVKDIQAHLRHTKADTTANVYMQELSESTKNMVESFYQELKAQPNSVAAS